MAAHAERVTRFGARSRDVIDWLTAQAAVFQNCAGGPLVLPPPAEAGSDARARADRDYQIAAAYFYATQYDEAAGRFRAIAANTASPWRAYGRYLAARALIRSVTVPATRPKDALQRFAAAERELQATWPIATPRRCMPRPAGCSTSWPHARGRSSGCTSCRHGSPRRPPSPRETSWTTRG